MGKFVSVNAWIVGPPGRQSIVDTGSPGPATAAIWGEAEAAGEVAGVSSIVCTHMHIDHTGQVPGLMQRHGASLHMTAREFEHLATQSVTTREDSRANLRLHRKRLGMDAASVGSAEPVDYTVLAPLPAECSPLLDGAMIPLGDTEWRVRLAGGHSRQAAVLLAADDTMMLAGDQLLHGAGPHISAGLSDFEADPLQEFLEFLDGLLELPDTMVVLPGHGAPFANIAQHAAALRQGHEKRLALIMAGIHGAMSCAQMVPLVFSKRAEGRFGDLLPDMTMALANHLWRKGSLRRSVDDEGVYRFEVNHK